MVEGPCGKMGGPSRWWKAHHAVARIGKGRLPSHDKTLTVSVSLTGLRVPVISHLKVFVRWETDYLE